MCERVNNIAMRKVIGIGETVLDITFKDNQPIGARPGGSVYNAMITLGRMGVNSQFISEVGNDRMGDMIKQFLTDNNVSNEYVYSFDGGKTPLALAFLDENMKPDYVFYKDYPKQRLDYVMPRIQEDDIIVLGSFFAINDVVRDKVIELLQEAKRKNAIIYYDLNFRKNHKDEVNFLMPNIIDNYEYATIIKGSDEDFENIYNETDAQFTYKEHIEFYSKNFVYTRGADGATVFGRDFKKDYAGNKVDAVSTVGAGDNFNAGLIYGLIKNNVTFADLKGSISEDKWDKVVKSAIDFSSFVCTTLDNYVSKEYAENYMK